MVEVPASDKALQDDIVEFQALQRQLQVTIMQKQQFSVQLEEIKLADEELDKNSGMIYRAIGSIIVQANKEDAKKDLVEKKEMFEMRVGQLTKQEEKLRKRLMELRDKLENAVVAGESKGG
jgi:prefoldin beta subunit